MPGLFGIPSAQVLDSRPALVEARVDALYKRLPTDLVSVLIAVLLCFIFLLESAGENAVKAWTAYMLSIVALRAWLWFVRGSENFAVGLPRRWEIAAACGALFTGIGWAMLHGPLYPADASPEARHFVEMMTVAIVFSAVINNSSSTLNYLAIVVPALAPAFARHWDAGAGFQHGNVPILAAILAIALLLQRNLAALEIDNLRRRIESEELLAEQLAIFESASLGIALMQEGRILKSNRRLGELLGWRLRDLISLPLATHFVAPAELQRMLDESATAFARDHAYQCVCRLRRADGSEFWAEFSGHALATGDLRSVWMIADVTMQAGKARHP